MVGIFCPSSMVEIGLTDLPKSCRSLSLNMVANQRFTTYVPHTEPSEGLKIRGGGEGHNLPPWLRQSKQNFDLKLRLLQFLMGHE